mmetsp:Transcript_1845/g.3762  ORF Transcript_1845/g.3762 Transcript_1845/m.3762 type:complete len:104 (-) Transcript_1845:333-644(-)
MMGIPVDGPLFVYCDNKSVINNTFIPESTLQKKSNSIAYHFVHEGCAKDKRRIHYVDTHSNLADLTTKMLAGGKNQTNPVRKVLWYIQLLLLGGVDESYALIH